MNLLTQIRTVLQSFIGLGRRKDMEQAQRSNPLVLILIAFLLVLVLLGVLAIVAHSAAKS